MISTNLWLIGVALWCTVGVVVVSPPDGSKFSVIGNFVVSKHYFHKHSFTISENVSYWLLRYFAPSLSKHVLLMLEALHKKVTSVSEAGTPKDTIPPLQRITFMQ